MAKKLNLKQIQYLLANKPLVIVQLEHSEQNKKLILKGLQALYRDPSGQQLFQTLQTFLEDRAPKYNLNASQMGARSFLLKSMERIRKAPPARSSGFGGMMRLLTG